MRHLSIHKETGDMLVFADLKNNNYQQLLINNTLNKMLYNPGENAILLVNGKVKIFKKNMVLFCKQLNNVEILGVDHKVKIMAFNKELYALETKEKEYKFYWFEYLEVKYPKFISLDKPDIDYVDSLFTFAEENFKSKPIEYFPEQQIMVKNIIKALIHKLQKQSKRSFLSPLQFKSIKKFNDIIENNIKTKNLVGNCMKFLKRSSFSFGEMLYQNIIRPFKVVCKSTFKNTRSLPKRQAKESPSIDYLEEYYRTAFSRGHQ